MAVGSFEAGTLLAPLLDFLRLDGVLSLECLMLGAKGNCLGLESVELLRLVLVENLQAAVRRR